MTQHHAYRLILASGSQARRELLERAGIEFDVMPADIEEPTGEGFTDPRTFVEHVAWLKAAAIAPRTAAREGGARTIVLAADTVGWLGGRAIGKPADRADARQILRTLSGTEHQLWTGVCLWRRPDDVQLAWQEVSIVAMRAMNDQEMDEYLDSRQWEGCSGAYAVQEGEDPYVRVVRGSRTNVIGLPMETLARVLPALADIR